MTEKWSIDTEKGRKAGKLGQAAWKGGWRGEQRRVEGVKKMRIYIEIERVLATSGRLDARYRHSELKTCDTAGWKACATCLPIANRRYSGLRICATVCGAN